MGPMNAISIREEQTHKNLALLESINIILMLGGRAGDTNISFS
jgi:hypothetical protein